MAVVPADSIFGKELVGWPGSASGLPIHRPDIKQNNPLGIFFFVPRFSTKIMQFSPPFETVTLRRRYKRFLADVERRDGTALTVHCPNTGTMLSCSAPGSPAAISVAANPDRKYPHTLEMVMANDIWIGVNTSRTNSLVAEAILGGQIDGFTKSAIVTREVKVADNCRLDLRISDLAGDTWMEIKNCSLAEDRCALFPDAVSLRGQKHLRELTHLAKDGQQAAIFFLVQRTDVDVFRPADRIDPVYGQLLRQAAQAGVTVLAYTAAVSPAGIAVTNRLPCQF